MDELFEFDADDSVGTVSQESRGCAAAPAETTSSTAQETTPSEVTDGADDKDDAFGAHSLPITIPQQISGKIGFKDGAVEGSFVPPHQWSLNHIAQSVPLSSSSRLRTRNKLLRSTGFLPTSCTHTEGFMVSCQRSSETSMTRSRSDARVRSMPGETELLESHFEPQIPLTSSSSLHFLRVASSKQLGIPESIHEVLS